MSNQPEPITSIHDGTVIVDRAEIIIQRAINCGWITVQNREQFKATIRIALDTEVRAGGPYLDHTE